MNKVFANLNQLVVIKVYYEVLTNYEFHPEEQDIIKTSFWGLYEEVVKWGKPARWVKPDHSDTDYNWLTDESVKEYKKTFRIQDHPKRLFKNPYVEIRYTNKDESKVYFKTDEELNKYVARLQNMMDLKLTLIVDYEN